MEGFDALVAGGFAFAAGRMVFYGRSENGQVESLLVEQGSDPRLGSSMPQISVAAGGLVPRRLHRNPAVPLTPAPLACARLHPATGGA